MTAAEHNLNPENIEIPKFILDCPIVADWVWYRGKVKFAMLNVDKSIEKGKAMIDLCYCATAGLINHRVEKTVQYSVHTFTLKP